MHDFVKGWRRKMGLAVLMLTLAFLIDWVRSYSTTDMIGIPSGLRSHDSLTSSAGRLIWIRQRDVEPELAALMPAGWFLIPLRADAPNAVEELYAESNISWRWQFAGFDFGRTTTRLIYSQMTVWSVPYWSIVLPLTALTAWLLLSKPRPAKRVEPAPTTGESHA